MDADYERILCVKQECFVYRIPPRSTSRGYRAADWKLEQPDWSGRLKIVTLGGKCFIKFEDKTSGELFAQAPIEQYPGVEVEAVTDSSRYFVIKIVDPSGKHAFIGMGFTDRGDSFDFNVTLQDFFKREKTSKTLEVEPSGPKLDLGFKEGQTIKINLAGKSASPRMRPKGTGASSIGVLPPPPGQKTPMLAPPPGSTPPQQRKQFPQQEQHQQTADLFNAQQPAQSQQNANQNDDWGDFSSSTSPSSGDNWVTF